jgi:hypothetical protein
MASLSQPLLSQSIGFTFYEAAPPAPDTLSRHHLAGHHLIMSSLPQGTGHHPEHVHFTTGDWSSRQVSTLNTSFLPQGVADSSNYPKPHLLHLTLNLAIT